jgi:glycosyltransferase involved in cell wall biosynthesis
MYNYCVFIPCYKAEKTIAETLKGVQEAISTLGREVPVYIYEDCGG